MRYLSVFSGVEAATVAWGPLGWEPVAFCEIDKAASEVLAARFPDVPNLGDITKVDWGEFNGRYGAIDVVVGGSPCQSFSIAGARTGLEGESRLMYEYIRCVREVVPRYFLWENVPGCLSSNKGGDFGCLLDELEECGYGMAWRTFDAQFARVPGGPRLGFFGPVPQRRRRVFLVGSLGSIGAAEILFERTCLRGDHPKGAAARESLAADPGESIAGSYSAGFKWFAGSRAKGIGFDEGTSPTITNSDGHTPAVLTPWDVQSKQVFVPEGVSPTLNAGGSNWAPMNVQPIVLTTANTGANGSNVSTDGCSYTLDGANGNAVCIQGNAIERDKGGAGGIGIRNDGCSYTLDTVDRHVVAFRNDATPKVSDDVCMTLKVGGMGGTLDAVAFAQNQRSEVRLEGGDGSRTCALAANPDFAKGQGASLICIESSQANAVIIEDESPTLNASHEQPVVCVAGDNGKDAICEDMCGSLKVGGGSP